MSLVFVNDPKIQEMAGTGRATIQKLLDENSQLIKTIVEYQNLGRVQEAVTLQETLHRNLVYLAQLSDMSAHLLAELKEAQDGAAPSNTQPAVLQSTENVGAQVQHQQILNGQENQNELGGFSAPIQAIPRQLDSQANSQPTPPTPDMNGTPAQPFYSQVQQPSALQQQLQQSQQMSYAPTPVSYSADQQQPAPSPYPHNYPPQQQQYYPQQQRMPGQYSVTSGAQQGPYPQTYPGQPPQGYPAPTGYNPVYQNPNLVSPQNTYQSQEPPASSS